MSRADYNAVRNFDREITNPMIKLLSSEDMYDYRIRKCNVCCHSEYLESDATTIQRQEGDCKESLRVGELFK